MSWFKANKLHLNASKTVFMNFTPKSSVMQESYLLKIEHKSIEQVNTTRFLGVNIDNKLNWDIHTENLSKKLCSICFAFYRLRNIANVEVMLSFYHAEFLSRVRYGLLFWGSSRHFNRIFVIQKKVLRNIVGASNHQSCRPIFKKLQLLPLICIYISELVIYVKSNEGKFIKNSDLHNYNTRNNTELVIPLHNSTLYEKSPNYIGIKCYNHLPAVIKDIQNIRQFKHELKKFLLEKSFYNLSEYFNH